MVAPQREQARSDEQFLAAVVPSLPELCSADAGDLVEQLPPLREIERPPVIRIHETEIPQLATLVDVRHPGHGQLQHQLRQRRDRRRPREGANELGEVGEERVCV